MNEILKMINDSFEEISQDAAIRLAKKHLKVSGRFAAIYGKKVKGEKSFFIPILVDENTLKSIRNDLYEEDPNSILYVLYGDQVKDDEEIN